MLSLFLKLLEQVSINCGDISGALKPNYGSSDYFLPKLRFYCCEVIYYEKFCKFTPVLFFLLSDSLASEFCMPTFRNTLFYLHSRYKEEE
jgi:hypothetical protein